MIIGVRIPDPTPVAARTNAAVKVALFAAFAVVLFVPLGYGFGALAIVGWEALEWLVSEDGIGGTDGLALTYGGTIGDLVLSSTGGLLGSLLAVRWLGPRSTAPA